MGTFRERLSNAYGTGKLLIGAAHIGRLHIAEALSYRALTEDMRQVA